MATIKICDRCGARIGTYKTRYIINDLNAFDIEKTPYGSASGGVVDLCENCNKNLENWMKEVQIGDAEPKCYNER